MGCGAILGLINEGVIGGALEVLGCVAGEGKAGIFEGSVADQPVRFGAVVHIVGEFGFYGVGVDRDEGGIGEQEFYAGGVHVEAAMDWFVHF